MVGRDRTKTEAAIEAAKGGVLFIDEAYSLFTNDKDGDKRDFGNRVIETLLPKLSDDNFGTIVILAGYPAEMKLLLESNPGLQSRFPFTFHFEDYSPEELLEIADLTVQREGYEITDSARQTLLELIKKTIETETAISGTPAMSTDLSFQKYFRPWPLVWLKAEYTIRGIPTNGRSSPSNKKIYPIIPMKNNHIFGEIR